jgi:hypothetical protein
MNLRDVRMVHGGEHVRFAPEPCRALLVAAETVRQDLQRNITAQPGVVRAIHLSHAAGPEFRHDVKVAEARA